MEKYINPELLERFEFRNYGHALEILSEAFPEQWSEIQECLSSLSISKDDILAPGGNESKIPKKFDDILYPYGWKEIRISGDLEVNLYQRLNQKSKRFSSTPYDTKILSGYIDGHNIDFIKDNFNDNENKFSNIKVMGPYVNFYIDYDKFNSQIITQKLVAT